MKEIGIKLADGSFYPILSDTIRSQKLELTTVRDKQETVQINLFRKDEGLEYIGSLIVEDIVPKKAGESTINLSLEIDNEENLKAEAFDAESGSKQSLKVSLATIDPNSQLSDFSLSDFDGSDTNAHFAQSPSENQVSEKEESIDDEEKEEKNDSKKKFPLWALILLCLLGIAILILAVLLLTRSCTNPAAGIVSKVPSEESGSLSTSTVPVPSDEEIAKQNAENQDTDLSGTLSDTTNNENDSSGNKTDTGTETSEVASNETGKSKSDEQTTVTAGTAATGNQLSANTDGSVRYLLKWGDTLWDLAETFYRDPWKYTIIAEYNKIKDPSYIIAGTYIDIPAR